jgi:adenylate kinase
MKEINIEAQADFLEKISKTKPIQAISEMIWNSLDADAKNVHIKFIGNEIGVDQIEINDDGIGFTYEMAIETFGKLGGSWKRHICYTSENNRRLHGKEGRGRFKIFTIGHNIKWEVSYKDKNIYYVYTVEGNSTHLDKFQINDKKIIGIKKTGVKVIITNPVKQYKIFDEQILLNTLPIYFAPYLSSYPDVNIYVDNKKVDIKNILKEKTPFSIETILHDENGEKYTSELEIFEWNGLDVKELYYCDKNGFPLIKYEKQIKNIGNYSYTGYLKSDYFSYLNDHSELDLVEMKEELFPLQNEVSKKIKELFATRYQEDHKSIIDKWKEDKVYPYSDKGSKTIIETAEEKVFDILAINLNEYIEDFNSINNTQKKLQLKLLQQAIELNPTNIKKIISEVINLPKEKADELADLLENTSLSSIISTSKIISDRLKFVKGFEEIIYDTELKKYFKERKQLHKILAENIWFFGEEFSLSVNDKSLNEVLKKHISHLKSDVDIDLQTPVLRPDGKKGIIDLMLSKSIPKNHINEYEYLVVELKAPSVKIGQKELNQIESYAFAVADDERFRNLKTRWEFWIISNDMDSIAKKRANQQHLPKGTIYQSNTSDGNDITIKIRTWSEILAENDYRYNFVKENLNISITKDDGLLFLQEKYAKYIGDNKVNKVIDKNIQSLRSSTKI